MNYIDAQVALVAACCAIYLTETQASNDAYKHSEVALLHGSLAISFLVMFQTSLVQHLLLWYKNSRYGHGSLQEQCLQRQRKFSKLCAWHPKFLTQLAQGLNVLAVVLLVVFLFEILKTQRQQTGMDVIYGVIVFGILILIFTSPLPKYLFYLFKHLFWHVQAGATGPLHPNAVELHSIVQWTLETSGDPAGIMLALKAKPINSILPVPLCMKVRQLFEACFQHGVAVLADNALEYGKALIILAGRDTDIKKALNADADKLDIWRSWRSLYLPWALGFCKIAYDKMQGSGANAGFRLQYQADTRSAMHLAVVAGIDGFTDPDDNRLIWGDLTVDILDYDWLMDCAEYFDCIGDVDAAGDALLLLSGTLHNKPPSSNMQNRIRHFIQHDNPSRRTFLIALRVALSVVDCRDELPSPDSLSTAVLGAILAQFSNFPQIANETELLALTEWPIGSQSVITMAPLHEIQRLVLLVFPPPDVFSVPLYWHTLVRYMHTEPSLRHTSLHKAYLARKTLLPLGTLPPGRSLRDMLSQAFLAAAFPRHSGASVSTNRDSVYYYIRLIFGLALSGKQWLPCLTRDGHINQLISIIPELLQMTSDGNPSPHLFYLLGIFLWMPGGDPQIAAITDAQWWSLTKIAWRIAGIKYEHQVHILDDSDAAAILARLATGAMTRVPQDASRKDLQWLFDWLQKVVMPQLTNRGSSGQGLKSDVMGFMNLLAKRLD